MELWFILAIIAYVSYTISTAIDKYMMNHHYAVFKTSTLKMFFDGAILFLIGIKFIEPVPDVNSLMMGILLGILFGYTIVVYYKTLRVSDAEQAIPTMQAGSLLLIFIASLFLFNERVNILNWGGLILILFGIYAVLSTDGLRLPSFDKKTRVIIPVIIMGTVTSLMMKQFLYNINPVTLGVLMYFSAAITIFIYNDFVKHRTIKEPKKRVLTTLIAALFGSIGTFLFFTALSIGDASKIFPMGGIQTVLMFFIATIFLKEKFYWHRLIGAVAVFFGIYFIYI